MQNLRSFEAPLHKYISLMELLDRDEKLFFKLLVDNMEELLPIVYTPTVGEAFQKYGSIFRCLRGLYISLNDKYDDDSVSAFKCNQLTFKFRI